jgi:glyoxylase I family protein
MAVCSRTASSVRRLDCSPYSGAGRATRRRRNHPDRSPMIFEHFALNVPDPAAQAQWYVRHLGFTIVRSRAEPPSTHFLADGGGRVAVELYHNDGAPVPDYAAADPLVFHFALVSGDAAADRRRLEDAGATLAREEPQPDGSLLVMMRDPWGVPLQLCQRTEPFS